MEWQRGVLVCQESNCIDHGILPLIGERELAIFKAFEIPTKELEPDPKLMNPDLQTSGDDLISF